MKTIIVLISTLTLLTAEYANGVSKGKNSTGTDSIHILSSPDLVDLAGTWAAEYTNDNPGAVLSVSGIPEEGLNDLLQGTGTISLLSKNYLSGRTGEGTWKMVVGRDVLVPVMNTDNPYRDAILQKGVSPEEFAGVIRTPDRFNWGTLLSNTVSDPVRLYSASDQSTRTYLSEFLDIDQQYIERIETDNADEMLECIANDRFAIGFCRLTDILMAGDREVKPGICLIPIDKNGNDLVDYFEDIYHNTSELTRGIWIGKYPAGLYSRVYMVTGTRQASDNELAFMEWLVTEGQQYLPENGLTGLIYSERQSVLHRINDYSIPLVNVPVRSTSQARILLIITGILLLAAIILYTLTRIFRNQKWEDETVDVCSLSVIGENSMRFPCGMFYDKSHTWIYMEKDGTVRTGIDDFLQHITGPITRVKLKKPGDRITKGEAFLSLVQRGKQLDIQSPVSGIIREHNKELVEDSELINDAPFSDGWVYVIEPGNWLKEIQAYIMGDKYREWLKTELSRLKNFLATELKPIKTISPEFVLQDGGEIRDGVLECYGPEAWEEFQSGFLHTT